MKRKERSKTATLLGVATSLVTALVLIDFDTIDWYSVNDWLKILVAALPALGGSVSELSENKKPPTD
jgi:hypothetical protein